MSNQHTYYVAIEPTTLLQDYAAGLTQVEIAKKHGATQKIVWLLMKKCGITARKAAPRNQKAEANNNWRGNAATYAALHKRVEAVKGTPKHCQVCGTDNPRKHYDWANVSGDYTDIDAYVRMCRSCHWVNDKKVNNIHRMRKRGQ